jgi:hypothetical protein
MTDGRVNRRQLLASAGAASLLPAFAGTAMASAPRQVDPSAFGALLRIGPMQPGADGRRWASVLAGRVTGGSSTGEVLSGRLEWCMDPATGAVDATVSCSLRAADGQQLELHERGIHATSPINGLVTLRAHGARDLPGAFT